MGAIAVVAAMALPATASAGPGVDRLERAGRLVDRALRAPSVPAGCARAAAPPPSAVFSGAAPSAALTERLAILRRPQSEADLAALARVERLPLDGVLRSGVRVAHGADGRSYDLVALAAVQPPPGCARAARAALRRGAREVTTGVRRSAAQQLRARLRGLARPERVAVFTAQGGAYGGGGGASAADLAAGRTGFGSFGGGPAGDHSVLYGVVPDGVARVTWVLADGRRVVAAVQDNVATGQIDAEPIALQLERTISEAADGTVIADVPMGR